MPKCDVVVIGAGSAGLVAGALLAKEGKNVKVIEGDGHLGGRAKSVPFEDGYKLNLGGHLLEDDGTGITKIMEYLGKELKHGPVSQGMPIYDQGKWKNIKDMYSSNKNELKKVIDALIHTEFSDLDKYDNIPMRHWLQKHTSDEGVISLFDALAMLECMTERWYDHSASDNLYVRKMHYEEKRTAGYSCWPVGGWDKLFQDLADVIEDNGGEVLLNTKVSNVIIENGRAKGVTIHKYIGDTTATSNEYPEVDSIAGDLVIITAPVWNLLSILDNALLPDWYTDQINLIAQDKYKVGWVGLHVATKEPLYIENPLELVAWFDGPRTRLPGWGFLMTGYDPGTAPPGVHVFHGGAAFQGKKPVHWIEEQFNNFEKDLEEMYPGFNDSNILWKRRHLVYDPPFGVIQKPGLVGSARPENAVPNIEGLFLAGETYKGRGIGVDRAARSALTVTEMILGQRIPFFTGTWRY